MTSNGIIDLFKYTITYNRFLILFNECHWYEFIKKNAIKEQLNFYYPLMVGEMKNTI